MKIEHCAFVCAVVELLCARFHRRNWAHFGDSLAAHWLAHRRQLPQAKQPTNGRLRNWIETRS